MEAKHAGYGREKNPKKGRKQPNWIPALPRSIPVSREKKRSNLRSSLEAFPWFAWTVRKEEGSRESLSKLWRKQREPRESFFKAGARPPDDDVDNDNDVLMAPAEILFLPLARLLLFHPRGRFTGMPFVGESDVVGPVWRKLRFWVAFLWRADIWARAPTIITWFKWVFREWSVSLLVPKKVKMDSSDEKIVWGICPRVPEEYSSFRWCWHIKIFACFSRSLERIMHLLPLIVRVHD